jgi:hypothetical protein
VIDSCVSSACAAFWKRKELVRAILDRRSDDARMVSRRPRGSEMLILCRDREGAVVNVGTGCAINSRGNQT